MFYKVKTQRIGVVDVMIIVTTMNDVFR